jgi:RNA polymerase sigma-70 factor, ECF subfamily
LVKENSMTTAAISKPSALTRSDVTACIPHLRAFAVMLVGDGLRADGLVHDTIEQTFTEVNRPRAGINLKLQMFSTLHRLPYGTPRPSTDWSTQREAPSSKEDGFDPDQFLSVFGRLSDEQREALILTVAGGLSYQQAAEVCGCHIPAIESRVSKAWQEISRALLDAATGRKRKPTALPSAIWRAPALA